MLRFGAAGKSLARPKVVSQVMVHRSHDKPRLILNSKQLSRLVDCSSFESEDGRLMRRSIIRKDFLAKLVFQRRLCEAGKLVRVVSKSAGTGFCLELAWTHNRSGKWNPGDDGKHKAT